MRAALVRVQRYVWHPPLVPYVRMVKTTVYLPEDLKFALRRVATARGQSEAEVIRVALQSLVDAEPRPRPRGGLFHSGVSDLASNDEEYLRGSPTRKRFGEW